MQRVTGVLAVALSSSLIAACSGFSPSPLDNARTDAVLSAPDENALAQSAKQLRHPRIPPITLDFSKPLTSDELAVIAVLVNPDLKAMRAKAGVADAQVFQAGLLPDPQLAVGLDRPTSGQAGLVNAYNVGVSWDILGILTRRAARRVAEAKRVQVREDIAWSEWLAANQVRLLAERVAFLEAQRKLAHDAASIAGRLLEASKRNLERHDIKIDEFALRQVAYLDAQDKALALARSLERARLDLNRNLGLPPSEIVPLATQPTASGPVRDAQALFEVARNARLDLVALRAGYQAQEYQLQRDLLGQFPKLNLGLHRARDTGNITTFGLSVGVTLPIFNGNRGAIAVSRATRAQLRAEYAARLFQTRSDIAILVADLERIDREMAPLVSQLPSLERAEAVMRSGVGSGDVTLIGYETVRAALLSKRLTLSSLEQAKAEQRIALQLATGAPWHS